MQRRAELVEQTRQRIVDAAVHLHTTVGPANTTISGVAEEAGVTRLTIYRHFADLEELFVACRGDWMERHRPPDAAAWPAIPDLAERAHLALGELYAWYGANRDDLFPINRDETSMPAGAQEARRAESAAIAGALIEGHVATGGPGRLLRAVAGHLVGYWTWRSLVVEQGLDHEAAVDLAVRVLMDAASGQTRRVPSRAGRVWSSSQAGSR
jgi:AcrR family transcriptional regulator